MKKRLFALLLAGVLCMTSVACGSKENTDEVDELASTMQDIGMTGILTPSDSVKNAMVKTWKVEDSEDIYVMEADGTGTKNGEAFTFECGFNKDNKITMNITIGEVVESYAISTDLTGYGVVLTGFGETEDKVLLPADLEFLSLDDERVAGIAAEWKDASGNIYKLGETFDLVIDGVNNDSEGTYSVVETADGMLCLNLVIKGSAYEYEIELNGNELKLNMVGDTTVHTWTK